MGTTLTWTSSCCQIVVICHQVTVKLFVKTQPDRTYHFYLISIYNLVIVKWIPCFWNLFQAFRVHVEGHYAVPQQREPICGAQNLAEPCRTYSTGTVKVITLSNAGSPAQPRGNPGQHGGIPVIGTPRLPNVRGNLKKVRQYQLRKMGDINLIYVICFSRRGIRH